MSRKKITMQQIANTAGVSKYVVSKTLNGKSGVSEKTREKILFVAQQLGYFKQTEQQKQDEVGKAHSAFVIVVIPERGYQHESQYWGSIIEGLSEEVSERQCGLVIINQDQKIEGMIQTKGLLGIIGVGRISSEKLVDLQQFNVPIVLIDHEEPLIKADAIFTDNYDGIYKMTSHLLTLGHEKLVFVGDTSFSKSFFDRWLGFRSAIEKANLAENSEDLKVEIPYETSFSNKFEKWVQERIDGDRIFPTAFVCANDDIASKVMKTLHQFSFRVPEDCSVTGFDNLDISLYTNPPLATVHLLRELLGKRAVSKLIWRKNHMPYPAEKIVIQGELMIRASVNAPKYKV